MVWDECTVCAGDLGQEREGERCYGELHGECDG